MSEFSPQQLKFQELDGLTARQLSEHHDVLYAGYVKKVNEIRAALQAVDLGKANATHSDIRELKLEEGFALNGVTLHERYFDGLKPGGSPPSGDIADLIDQDFGSFEKWSAEMLACGMSARGWVVLAFDLKDGKLHNYLCDMHNQGGVWGAIPLVVLDVYEHAYFLDHATARKKYLEIWFKNIDWSAANVLIAKYGLKQLRG